MAQPTGNIRVHAQGLKDFGYVEGQNIGLTFRWAVGSVTRCRCPPKLGRTAARLTSL